MGQLGSQALQLVRRGIVFAACRFERERVKGLFAYSALLCSQSLLADDVVPVACIHEPVPVFNASAQREAESRDTWCAHLRLVTRRIFSGRYFGRWWCSNYYWNTLKPRRRGHLRL